MISSIATMPTRMIVHQISRGICAAVVMFMTLPLGGCAGCEQPARVGTPEWAQEMRNRQIEHEVAATAQIPWVHPIARAIMSRDAAEAMRCIEASANINGVDGSGRTQLHYAVSVWRPENLDVARALVARGANVNARGRGGATPLHCACERGNREVARLLIQNGAEVNARDDFGYTPLVISASNPIAPLEIIRVLLESGADRNLATNDGETPAKVLRALGYSEAADFIEKWNRHNGT